MVCVLQQRQKRQERRRQASPTARLCWPPLPHLPRQHEAVVAVDFGQVQPGGIRQEDPGKESTHNASTRGAVERCHRVNLQRQERGRRMESKPRATAHRITDSLSTRLSLLLGGSHLPCNHLLSTSRSICMLQTAKLGPPHVAEHGGSHDGSQFAGSRRNAVEEGADISWEHLQSGPFNTCGVLDVGGQLKQMPHVVSRQAKHLPITAVCLLSAMHNNCEHALRTSPATRKDVQLGPNWLKKELRK